MGQSQIANQLIDLLARDPRYVIMIVLGLLVVLLFARDKYDRPSYDPKEAAVLPRLSPRMYAPTYRYRSGYSLYLMMLGALYLVTVLVGPQLARIPSLQLNEPWTSPEYWPIGVAILLGLMATLDDSSYLGRLEAKLRRIAHEFALIPIEARQLQRRFRSAPLTAWNIATDPARKARISNSAAPVELTLIGQALVTDYREKWLRTAILMDSIEVLMSTPNVAFRVGDELKEYIDNLGVKKSALRTLVDEDIKATEHKEQNRAQIDKIVVELEEQAALLLAIIVFQGMAAQADRIVAFDAIGFKSGDAPPPRNGTIDFLVVVMMAAVGSSFLAIVAAVIYVTATTGQLTYLKDSHKNFLSGVFLYAVVFMVAHTTREMSVRRKNWEQNYIAFIRKSWIVAAYSVLFLLPLTILFIWPSVTADSIVFFTLFTLPVSALTCWFYFKHMMRAAMIYPRNNLDIESTSDGSGIRRVLLNATLRRTLRLSIGKRTNCTDLTKTHAFQAFEHAVLAFVLAGCLAYAASWFQAQNVTRGSAFLIDGWLSKKTKKDERILNATMSMEDADKISHFWLAARPSVAEIKSFGGAVELGKAEQQVNVMCSMLATAWAKNFKLGLVPTDCDELRNVSLDGVPEQEKEYLTQLIARLHSIVLDARNALDIIKSDYAFIAQSVLVAWISSAMAFAFSLTVLGWRRYELSRSVLAESRRRQLCERFRQDIGQSEPDRGKWIKWLTEPLENYNDLTRLEIAHYAEYEQEFLVSRWK